jgi:hypothetical protein
VRRSLETTGLLNATMFCAHSLASFPEIRELTSQTATTD